MFSLGERGREREERGEREGRKGRDRQRGREEEKGKKKRGKGGFLLYIFFLQFLAHFNF